jgi:hypothetical protein
MPSDDCMLELTLHTNELNGTHAMGNEHSDLATSVQWHRGHA